jgi:hypothetical protein
MTPTAWELAVTTSVEKNAPETLAQAVATRRLPITYQDAVKGLLLAPPNTIHHVTEAVGPREYRSLRMATI